MAQRRRRWRIRLSQPAEHTLWPSFSGRPSSSGADRHPSIAKRSSARSLHCPPIRLCPTATLATRFSVACARSMSHGTNVVGDISSSIVLPASVRSTSSGFCTSRWTSAGTFATIRRLADPSESVERLTYQFDTHLTPALPQNLADRAQAICLRKDPTGAMTMRRCSKPVGTIWRGLGRRATCTPADARKGSSWTSSVRSPATRRHALVLLSCAPAEQRTATRRGHKPSYGPTEVALLRVCWAATDGICSKRLAPFLPELLERLRYWRALHHISREMIERVAHMSPATIDRALTASRDGVPQRGLSRLSRRSRSSFSAGMAVPSRVDRGLSFGR